MIEVIASSAEDARDGYDLKKAMEWFDLSQEDRDRTMQLGEISDSVAEAIIETFYEHLLSDPLAAQHFHGRRPR